MPTSQAMDTRSAPFRAARRYIRAVAYERSAREALIVELDSSRSAAQETFAASEHVKWFVDRDGSHAAHGSLASMPALLLQALSSRARVAAEH